MDMQYEWQIFVDPDGLVSIVIRMTNSEAAALVGVNLKDPAQPDVGASQDTQRQLIETMQQAVIDGFLVVPG